MFGSTWCSVKTTHEKHWNTMKHHQIWEVSIPFLLANFPNLGLSKVIWSASTARSAGWDVDPDNLNGQCDLFLKWIHHNGYIITSFPYFYGTITDRCLRVEDSLQFMAIVFFFPLNNSIFEDALQAAFSKKNWLAFRRYLARPPDSSARWGHWEGMTELDGA